MNLKAYAMTLQNKSTEHKLLVFGTSGMLGQRTAKYFSEQSGWEIVGADIATTIEFPGVAYTTVDSTDRDAVHKVIKEFKPDVIINASAYTNVDKSEIERDLVWKINASSVGYIAEAGHEVGAHVVHVSTDYVFDGERGMYGEDEPVHPINHYGHSKLAGEQELIASGVHYTIIRTNVLYGIIPNGRLDFVRWVVESIRKGDTIRIVTDQYNNPTFIDDIVVAMDKIIKNKKYGIYNTAGKEYLSRYDFTLRIADVFGLDRSLITTITTPELKQPAPRPLRGGLKIEKAQIELGYSPIDLDASLYLMKKELQL
jgi:dTDP-4-dehydrorhamnose reductase